MHLWKLIDPSPNSILYICISTKICVLVCVCTLCVSVVWACISLLVMVIFYFGSNLQIWDTKRECVVSFHVCLFLFQYWRN